MSNPSGRRPYNQTKNSLSLGRKTTVFLGGGGLILALVFGLLQTSQTGATQYSVCSSGCDYTTISAALSAASSGDIIDVQEAIHTEAAIVIAKNITIQGKGQNSTIVQAAATQGIASDGVFEIEAGYTVIFKDFTIKNGNAKAPGGSSSKNDGGGVYIACDASSNISFTRVTITNNRADNDTGGGVFINGTSGTVSFTDCVISGNEANYGDAGSKGGGVYQSGSSNFTMTGTTIMSNSAGDDGAAIYLKENGSTNQFINCVFYNNTAGGAGSTIEGGAVYLEGTGSSFTFINCSMVNNQVTTGTTRTGGGIHLESGTLNLTNTIVANNSGASDAASGDDIFQRGGSMTITTSIVEDCDNCSSSPTYTSDPNVGPANTCGNHLYFNPQAPSDAIGNGTVPGGSIPADDICGNTRSSHDIGASESVTLPVELLGFDARNTEDGNLLIWETATELNNKGFHPQRSQDARNWESIGFVEGNGTTSTPQQYQYTDTESLLGTNYYRLRQVDFNGDFVHSEVLEVAVPTSDQAFQLFPNPTQGPLEIVGATEDILNIKVWDLSGRILKEQQGATTEIDLSSLPAGMYSMTIQTRKGLIGRKIVKE
ncbi:MAG: T9SS type A sorting domain-containing protein [Bacteroidota bacterium]